MNEWVTKFHFMNLNGLKLEFRIYLLPFPSLLKILNCLSDIVVLFESNRYEATNRGATIVRATKRFVNDMMTLWISQYNWNLDWNYFACKYKYRSVFGGAEHVDKTVVELFTDIIWNNINFPYTYWLEITVFDYMAYRRHKIHSFRANFGNIQVLLSAYTF